MEMSTLVLTKIFTDHTDVNIWCFKFPCEVSLIYLVLKVWFINHVSELSRK